MFSSQDFRFDSYINVFFILKALKNSVTQTLLLIQDEIKLKFVVTLYCLAATEGLLLSTLLHYNQLPTQWLNYPLVIGASWLIARSYVRFL